MAIYHFSGQVMSRSQGRSAVAAAAYRSAEKMQDERQALNHDYTKKANDILYKEVLLPEGAPEWMKERAKLWNAVEQKEHRKDAQLAREFNIALPKEFTKEQNIALAREFVQKEFVDKGMAADFCIHKGDKGNEEQPHMHVMLTMREITPEGFGKKIREWNSRELLEEQREAWANTTNQHLALNGFEQRIDHRSYAEQGIDLEPQYKIGPKTASARMARYADHQRIAHENGEKIYADPKVVLTALTRQQSTFTHQDLARVINTQTTDEEQFQRVYEKVKYSEEIVYLGKDEQGRERLTTKEMLTLEKTMLERSAELGDRRAHAIAKINHQVHFSDQQKEALEHIINGKDLICIVGYAGTGKSTILSSARKTWEREGYRVHGVTLSGIAAENLTGASGIESRTAASRFYYWDRGREQLNSKDVLVVDEAGMLGSRQMARIIEEVHRSGAKLVLIGDPQQLQAIEAGAAFRAIAEETHYAELTEVRRQQEKWQQEATKEFAQGKVAEALERYAQHDHLHEYETQAYAKQGLVETWNDVRLSHSEQTQIMLAYTRNDVKDLNESARELRKQNNELGEEHAIQTERGERLFAANDRIYFLQNERSLGVMNGTLGTIEEINGSQITVRLDKGLEEGGNTLTVDTNFYNHLEHGYAATIHKAQGVTVDRSYVLASKYMDSHSSYVSMSRHRKSTDLFWGKDEFKHSRDLAYYLGRDRSKDVTLDYGAGYNEQESVTKEQQEESLHLSKEQELAPQQEAQEHTQELRRLTAEEIRDRYALKERTAQEFKEHSTAHQQKTSIQEFRERYQAEHPDKVQSIKERMRPLAERKALQLKKEFQLLEKAIVVGHTPETHQRELEKCAHKMFQDREIMDYLHEHNPELVDRAQSLNRQHEQTLQREQSLKMSKEKELEQDYEISW